MQISKKRFTVAGLLATGAEELDLSRIVGIAVTNQGVHTMEFGLPATIQEKMQARIPAWDIPAGSQVSFIKSIQLTEGLLIVETEGPLTILVKDTIDAIIGRLIASKMTTGFFPASAGIRAGQYYYGSISDDLRNVTRDVDHVRITDTGLIFTKPGDNRIYALDAKQIDQPWTSAATSVFLFEQGIKSMGRVQNGKIDVVLMNNLPLRVTLGERSATIKVSSLLQQGVTAVFGTIHAAEERFLAALQGQELILVAAPAR